MDAVLLVLAGWLDTIGVSAWTREVSWAYPAANVCHILGLVMLVGGIGVVDLRVVGIWRGLPLAEVSRALTPVAVIGLAIQLVSGLVLFGADGKALAVSPIFHLKLMLTIAALANAALFRLAWRDAPPSSSVAARLSAAASLLLWLAVATSGRLIAYY